MTEKLLQHKIKFAYGKYRVVFEDEILFAHELKCKCVDFIIWSMK